MVPKEDEMIGAGEKLKNMLAIWEEAIECEKADMLFIMLDAVCYDTNPEEDSCAEATPTVPATLCTLQQLLRTSQT